MALVSEDEVTQYAKCDLSTHTEYVEIYSDVIKIIHMMAYDDCYTIQDLYRDLIDYADRIHCAIGKIGERVLV